MKLRSIAPRRRGFTLIEVMITVAILAVLASVAYPAYTDYIRKGRRGVAQGALMDISSRQQTYLLDRRLYAGSLATLGYSTPAELTGAYTVTVVCVPADCSGTPAFTATASPSASLAAKGEQTLTINEKGEKTPANTSGYWGK